jgi:hypothetical protein
LSFELFVEEDNWESSRRIPKNVRSYLVLRAVAFALRGRPLQLKI